MLRGRRSSLPHLLRPTHRFGFRVGVAFFTFVAPVAAAQSPAGHFNGRARLFNREVPIELEIARADTGWRGDLTVPNLGVRDRPFSRVSIVGATVELVLAAPWNVTFAGTFSPNGDTLAGHTRGRDSSAFSAVRGPDLTAQREAALGLPPLTPIGARATATLSIPGSADFLASVKTGAAEPRGELSVAAGAGSVWVLSDSTGVLSRIDAATNTISDRIPVLPSSYAADFGFGSVWITNTAASSVQRIDPTTNKVVATIAVGPTPRFLVVGEGGVWTLNQGDGTVTRIDPATNRVAATIGVGVPGNGGDIAAGGGRVYVRAGFVLLSLIDPATNRVVERYGPTSGSGGVRVAGNRVWVTAHDIKTVWVLDANRP